MIYLFITIVLFTGMIFYFRIADRYNIIDKPNERSSHDYITIRGGGIVFWMAGTIYSLFHFPESLCFLTGLTLICGVSFWDDISSLPNKIRIVIHFLSISFAFYGFNLYAALPWYLIFAAYIFFVGVLNAYNFMDGINGITGLYSLAVLIALQYVNYNVQPFTHPDFITYAVIACLVFLFFNCRKKAKCFAGDVGSLGISFWIVLLILQLALSSGSLIWLFFLSVYGVDSIHTLLHRLCLRQNIFKAHRLHFYQILSNERKIAHWKVSSAYALLQLSVNGLIIYFYACRHQWTWPAIAIIVGVLSLIYWIKPRLMQTG